MELKFEADQIQIEHGRFKCEVVAEVEGSEILKHFTAADIAEHFEYADLLEAIGEHNVREHFGIGGDD